MIVPFVSWAQSKAQSNTPTLRSRSVTTTAMSLPVATNSSTDLDLYRLTAGAEEWSDETLKIYVGALSLGADVTDLRKVEDQSSSSKNNKSSLSEMTELALKLRDGDGVKKNKGMAIVLLKRAAED